MVNKYTVSNKKRPEQIEEKKKFYPQIGFNRISKDVWCKNQLPYFSVIY